ncbi:hypothetical protein U6A24_09720 [Aquimarina gracilis]|uniref:DUF7079 domain-containing protein n=1 Tax=Aquimarina gracilis TaxID=874422 RepID=A0ABU5ZUR4_9FLAO|nr:hypothetical protein [Aquimarina gracilis]MEB3345739.1 hypothetical protein [Aquimarina gracilis]
MKSNINISERKPVWKALSELYLDNELQDSTYSYMVAKFVKSPYDFNEIKYINRYEVFPVLYRNLLSVAGEWAGFEEQWLIRTITNRFNKKNLWTTLNDKAAYFLYHKMYKKDWEILKAVYDQTKN